MITFFDILKRRLKLQTVTQKTVYNTFLTFNSHSFNVITIFLNSH